MEDEGGGADGMSDKGGKIHEIKRWRIENDQDYGASESENMGSGCCSMVDHTPCA